MRGISSRQLIGLIPLCAVVLSAILIAAPRAAGQAAIDQYIPQGDPAAGSGGAIGRSDTLGPGGAGVTVPAAIAERKSDGGGGTLPFADYPSTSFVWVVAAILLLGAIAGLAARLRKRRALPGAD